MFENAWKFTKLKFFHIWFRRSVGELDHNMELFSFICSVGSDTFIMEEKWHHEHAALAVTFTDWVKNYYILKLRTPISAELSSF